MSNDFLSFLVNETYKLQSEGENRLHSMENKIQDSGLEFLKGEFIAPISVFRFKSHLGNIDVPVRWDLFDLNQVETGYRILDEQNDQQHFFSVIQAVWKIKVEKILMIQADGYIYLVGLKVGDDNFLRSLINNKEVFRAA